MLIDIEGRRAMREEDGYAQVRSGTAGVTVEVGNTAWDGLQRAAAYLTLSPAEARKLAQRLAEAADNAERAGR